MNTLTEAQIIAKHSPSVRPRAALELQIVNALIARAETEGCKLTVYPTGEGDEYSDQPYDVRTALFDLDDAHVTVDGHGWVRLVFGNDGYDLISDYSLSCEEFLRPVLDLADTLGR